MSNQSKNTGVFYSENLGSWERKVAEKRAALERDGIIKRIWDIDHKVWKNDPNEISNRLGWLKSPSLMSSETGDIARFAKEVIKDGIEYVVVLGMGGSSLSCEVFKSVFVKRPGFPELYVLDTTNPAQIRSLSNKLEPDKTVVIVSTKSGTTVETMSLLKYFYRKFVNEIGENLTGKHFISITDPGTSLVSLSGELHFREVFLNDPEIGGRFSVLSFFGIVPAAIAGVEIDKVLLSALDTAKISTIESLSGKNINTPAAMGIAMGELANNGINKMRIVTSEKLNSFSLWLEQLVAESTGKEGKSILPVYEDGFDKDSEYGKDSYFVFLSMADDEEMKSQIKNAKNSGVPVMEMVIKDQYETGDLFFRWEFAVSVAGAVMGINPFDQPNVEESKKRAKKLVEDYKTRGTLERYDYDFTYNGIDFYDSYELGSVDEFEKWIAEKSEQYEGRYICFQLYLEPSDIINEAVNSVVAKLRNKYMIPVVAGFGPRYLHSSGQLHKGDAGKGIFLQICSEIKDDVPIPDSTETDSSSLTFGILNTAQAIGDYLALRDKQRDVVRLQLGSDAVAGLMVIADNI